MDETRLVDLESRIAFLEKSWDDLNEVVVDQQRSLQDLQRLAQGLEQQLKDLRTGGDRGPSDAPPPHY